MTLFGGVNVLPGKVGKVAVNLPVGSYYAADIERNRPSAFTAFAVSGADTGASMKEGSTVKAVKSASWAKSRHRSPRHADLQEPRRPEPLRGHREAQEGQDGQGLRGVGERPMEGEEGPPPVDFAFLRRRWRVPGQTVAMNYRLPKGDYILTCFWPDASMGGMPHAFMGMFRGIRLA